MDGECVSNWLGQTLTAFSARVQKALTGDLQGTEAGHISEELRSLNALVYIAQTLEPQGKR